jgi:hypothetical protein
MHTLTRAGVVSQCESHRRNPEHIGFGSATRKNMEKQFISHEHSKNDGSGIKSPGPAGYGPGKASVGPQVGFCRHRFSLPVDLGYTQAG